jgi:spore germination cell wall hydrolase CwlJ-like protein
VNTKAGLKRLAPALLLGLTISCVPAKARPLSETGQGPKPAQRLSYQLVSILLSDAGVLGTRAVTAAAPFRPLDRNSTSEARALECLASAVYHEARSESVEGQRAVAQVVLNRVRHYAYPSSVCGVVHQGPMRAGGGCQFTFTCDGSLRQRREPHAWQQAREIAQAALDGHVEDTVGWATHYHSDYVRPRWSGALNHVATIGSHIFYTMRGKAGGPLAFVRSSASLEAVTDARKGPAPEQIAAVLAAPEEQEMRLVDGTM